MTACAAHVAAVAEALAGSWRIAADSTSRAIAREVAYAEATVAVETLTPLIRAQIAAEIRAVTVRHLSREFAARIAEGQS
jgi:hypothetical protein